MFRKLSKWFITHCKMEICISSINYSVDCYSVHKNCIITLYERELCSTILPGKNCVLLNSVQEFIEIEAWLLLTFFIKFYAFYCQTLKNKMLEKGGSSNRQKKRLLLSPSFTTKFVFVFVLSQESAFSQRFYFEANRKSWVLLKIGTRDFQNSPPFGISACFFILQ